MAKLIKGKNQIIAKANIDIQDAGLNENNCKIVFEKGESFKSWQPGRTLNALVKFVKGNEYIIEAKSAFAISKL